MEAKPDLVMDVFAWLFNVLTSVLIVFVNKILIDPRMGYGFVFATTLCAFHFLACGGSVWLMEACGIGTRKSMPFLDCLVFASVASVSIASLNLSLLVNSVGFYQVSKLLIIPFVCLVEYIWMNKRFTLPTVLSIGVVVCGVGIVTVTDVSVNPLGIIIAAVSVVTSGMQQIMCGTVQRKHNLTPNQLLSNSAPLQGGMLLLLGPFVDKLMTDKWIMGYHFPDPVMGLVAISCAVAVLVNISQFMCLGRFSAVTFQVLGHTKTVLVLLCGWLFLHDVISGRKLLGMIVAVAGMMAYGYFVSSKPAGSPLPVTSGRSSSVTTDGPAVPLLGGKGAPGGSADAVVVAR